MSVIPTTITEQIEQIESTEISYRNLHTKAEIQYSSGDMILIPYANLISKYRYFLLGIIIEKDFDDELARTYLYSPKKLSYDIYGTTELWAELLRLNKCSTITEFKPEKRVKVYDPDRFKAYINEILILENIIQ